jgi:hypothetical protein
MTNLLRKGNPKKVRIRLAKKLNVRAARCVNQTDQDADVDAEEETHVDGLF